ncbi:hypothetical protein HanRHA438_Chr07g0304691 [Helianthus annuus]|nr:hypothetical protein HanRHA438_Chr07g0304691 [Helianthus annuus]
MGMWRNLYECHQVQMHIVPATQVPPRHPVNGPHFRTPPPSGSPTRARGSTMAPILLQPS